MIARIRNEPALVSGLIVVLLNLGAAFGLDLTAEQTGAITAASAAILAFVVRSQVTPTRKPTSVRLRIDGKVLRQSLLELKRKREDGLD